MPATTPSHSPSRPPSRSTTPQPTALYPSPRPLPSTTPGCLERRNIVVARADPAQPRGDFWTNLVRSPLVDLYANRPQHQFAYYLLWHMGLFYFVYRHQGDECNRPPTRCNKDLEMAFAWYDEIMPFCLYTGLYPPPSPLLSST